MLEIGGSVGKAGVNRPEDILVVKYLLNRNGHLLAPYSPLLEDANLNSRTLALIERYQERITLMTRPDRRVDPHGKTIRHLNINAREESSGEIPPIIYPLENWAEQDIRSEPASFAALRKDGRRHAGCDLYAPADTPVLAIKDGRIITKPYPFYLGTMALEVDHGNCVVRYGELDRIAVGLEIGTIISAGQLIAYIGELDGLGVSMLHMEMYTGRTPGPLTDRGNLPFLRRGDLINPTSFLESAVLISERRDDDADRTRAARA
ncbi:MAG: M23 family metallopeptidase [bacterium]|nr:M23 family metallopeptidase [bacterium]